MNTFENALKKLDQIEQNLQNQGLEIIQKTQEISEKDNRNAQLHKLFQGTDKIFSKQHDYVDKLKTQLEAESKDKNLSQEQVKHLQKDVEIYTNWKNSLLKDIEEMKETEKKSLEIRDKEI